MYALSCEGQTATNWMDVGVSVAFREKNNSNSFRIKKKLDFYRLLDISDNKPRAGETNAYASRIRELAARNSPRV